MISGWVYDQQYMNDDFNYEDLEQQYLDNQAKNKNIDSRSLKEQLDQAHKSM